MIICWRCYQELNDHHECKGLTRRLFFGIFGAGALAAGLPSAPMALAEVYGKPERLTCGMKVKTGDIIIPDKEGPGLHLITGITHLGQVLDRPLLSSVVDASIMTQFSTPLPGDSGKFRDAGSYFVSIPDRGITVPSDKGTPVTFHVWDPLPGRVVRPKRPHWMKEPRG